MRKYSTIKNIFVIWPLLIIIGLVITPLIDAVALLALVPGLIVMIYYYCK